MYELIFPSGQTAVWIVLIREFDKEDSITPSTQSLRQQLPLRQ